MRFPKRPPASPLRRWFGRDAKVLAGVFAGGGLLIGGAMLWNIRPPAVTEPRQFAPVPPPEEFAPLRLRVVTWNVWGLNWITPRCGERFVAIARETALLRPDIVGFQEAFARKDRETLVTALRPLGLVHARYFPSGFAGSGLLLVSRYPIESEGFVRFVSNAPPLAFHHGDWWAGKGLSLSTVRLPNGTRLYVGNTHLQASYQGSPYHEIKLAQATQLIPWIRRVQATGCPALWIGDWNNPPDNDVMTPLIEAGAWSLLTASRSGIDHIFGSGTGWEWRVIAQDEKNGILDGGPPVPWSDHAARWVDVELQRKNHR